MGSLHWLSPEQTGLWTCPGSRDEAQRVGPAQTGVYMALPRPPRSTKILALAQSTWAALYSLQSVCIYTGSL